MRSASTPRPHVLSAPKPGFTLVELVTVITIVIILAGLVVPRVTAATERAKIARAASDMKGMKKALLLLQQDLGRFPTTTGETSQVFLQKSYMF
ncbi:MAG: prepilin-type N-terminal cleavage/methylation domain-containing protein [Planctomycetota bacterium]